MRPVLPILIAAAMTLSETLQRHRNLHKSQSNIAASGYYYTEADWSFYTGFIDRMNTLMGLTESETMAYDYHLPTRLKSALNSIVTEYLKSKEFDFPSPYFLDDASRLTELELTQIHRGRAQEAAKNKNRTPPVNRRTLIKSLLKCADLVKTDESGATKSTTQQLKHERLSDLFERMAVQHEEVRDFLWRTLDADLKDVNGTKYAKQRRKSEDKYAQEGPAALRTIANRGAPKKVQ